MRKRPNIKDLDRIAILGVGLLGGSIGLALRSAGFAGMRVGIARRASTLRRARQFDAVDETTTDPARGVTGAELVILCTPVGQFERVLRAIAPALRPGCIVTDVGSTKAEVVALAERILPKTVHFIGSHPMAGSEKTGVEFSRADLYQRALCLVTPTPRSAPSAVRFVRTFWGELGARTMTIDPQRHDELLARASHLPHAVATALVHLAAADGAIELAGPGFGDTTRIASGDPGMWTDIFRSNRRSTLRAIDELRRELAELRRMVSRNDAEALYNWLAEGKKVRDRWIARRYRKGPLPP